MIVTRRLSAADAAAFAGLRRDGIARYPGAFLLTAEEAAAVPEDRLAAWLGTGAGFGAFDGPQMIGLAALSRPRAAMARHRAELGPFYVTPAYQGIGVAQRLLQDVIDAARRNGVLQIELWVSDCNTRARVFYEAAGFDIEGRLPRAILRDGEAENDLLLVLPLDGCEPASNGDGLRRLQPADWRAFREIRLLMLSEAAEVFGSTLAFWQEKTPSEVRAWLRQMHVWASVEDGRCLACAAFSRMPGSVAGHRAQVISVYTRPEARRRGLFARVMAALERDARAAGITQLELDVAMDNKAARSGYARLGYHEIGRRPRALNHDGRISDEVAMAKILDMA